MRTKGPLLAALLIALTVPAVASADTTLGNSTPPAGTTAVPCGTGAGEQLLTSFEGGLDGPYVVQNGPLAVSQWQINAAGAASGTKATLVVFSVNLSSESITVLGADTETLSTVGLPASGVETFNLSSPIAVQTGDVIGLYLPSSSDPGIACGWTGSSVSSSSVSGLALATPPTTGGTITIGGATGFSSSSSVLNLSATLEPLSYDAALSLASGPSNAVAGQPAVLTATVKNNGPIAGPITFTDPVPNGLKVEAASIGSGACGVEAAVNIVTCETNTLSAGQSTEAVIVVVPGAAGSYPDHGAVSLPSGTDPNSANNTGTTTLKVSRAGAPTVCTVPKLGGASESLAKNLLPLLGCKAGKVKKATSKSVPKGDVISTSPGAGRYAAGKSIGITISSGKPKSKKKK